jgi:predicted DNA-binding ribbon-helix-helix protein
MWHATVAGLLYSCIPTKLGDNIHPQPGLIDRTPPLVRATATGSRREMSMKSQVFKRSVVIAGHKTSVSLEDAFWKGLKEIAGGRNMTLSDLVARIDSGRQHGNLSSAIRLFVLDFYRDQPSNRRPEHDEARVA